MRVSSLCTILTIGTSLFVTACDSSSSSSDANPANTDPSESGTTTVVDTVKYTKNDFGIPWNDSIKYLVFRDPRDSQIYRAVTIGKQTWMAENLNYLVAGIDSGVCESSKESCSKYGRIYKWNTIMGGSNESSKNPSGVRGICPLNWHLPSVVEWDEMLLYVQKDLKSHGISETDGLKSKTGWASDAAGNNYSGIDHYGFRATPCVYMNKLNPGLSGRYVGNAALWWTTSERKSTEVYAISLYYDSGMHNEYGDYAKDWLMPVRCVKD